MELQVNCTECVVCTFRYLIFMLPLVIHVDFMKGVYRHFFTIVNGFFLQFLHFFQKLRETPKKSDKILQSLKPKQKKQF